MITLNDTPTTDNAVKWVVKILGDNNTYYMTDTDGGLVLTNTYIGDGLLKTSDFETLSQITDAVDISVGGNIDQVSSFTFGLIRWSSNANLNGFMNEFYPATSGEYLVGREVNVGLIWAGTTDAEITWLKRFYIEDYDYTPAFINIYCVEKSELDLFELPYYEIQKDTDNGISYFPKAPFENYGVSIPVVYGEFVQYDWVMNDFSLSPCLLVNNSNSQYVVASHKVHTTSDSLKIAGMEVIFKYINGLKAYELIYNNTGTIETNDTSHTITMQNTLAQLLGEIKILLKDASGYSTITDVGNATDWLNSALTGTRVALSVINDRLALRAGLSTSTSDLGVLASSNTDVAIKFNGTQPISSVLGFDYLLSFRNETLQAPANADGNDSSTGIGYSGDLIYEFGTNLTAKNDTTIPYKIEELLSYEYFLLYQALGSFEVNYAYLHLQNIIIGAK